jgi:hypothetical protein
MTDTQTIAEAWRKEALLRSAEIDSGLVETVSAEQAFVGCNNQRALHRKPSSMRRITLSLMRPTDLGT